MQGLRQQCQISFGLMLSTFLSSIFLSELGLKIHKTKFSEYQDLNLGQLGEEKDVRFGAVLPPKKVNVQKVSFKIMSCFFAGGVHKRRKIGAKSIGGLVGERAFRGNS